MIAVLWVAGGWVIGLSVSELQGAAEYELMVHEKIASGARRAPQDRTTWQDVLNNVRTYRMLIYLVLTVATSMILAGLSLLYWPWRRQRVFATH